MTHEPLTLEDAWRWAETQAEALLRAVREARAEGNTARAAEQAAALERTAATLKHALRNTAQPRLI